MGILNKAELEAGGFSSAVDGYNRNRNVSVTAYGVLPGTNQVMNTLIQNAIIDASDNGFGGLIFPGGKFLVDPTTPILVPSNFTIEGLAEQTIFEVQNTNFPDSGTFPAVSKAIFAVGRIKDHPDHVGVTGWRRGDRYGRESGRRTIGSGATFNFTVTSGKVTAATIAAGGTLYRIGDRLNFDNGTYLIVSGVSNYEAGVITSIVIGNQGSGWGTATNPYTQTNTTGRNPSDRIFDLDSFADNVHFRNFVLDGKYGFGNIPLTGTKGYNGIDARGILRFSAKGITMRGFSETGLYVFDVKNAEIENNFADDCGWTGVFGRSRNGFSNIGLYSVTQPQLNTEYWIFKNNIARKCGDVGAQFSNVENFVVSGNTLLGCGTIGIEGESLSLIHI